MTLEEIIAKLADLSAAANKEEGPQDKVISGEDLEVDDLAPKKHAQALTSFLKKQSEVTLRAIEGLMYSGRDGRVNPITMVKELMIHDKDSCVHMIDEKFPRMEYIKAGLKHLNKNSSLAEYETEVAELVKDRKKKKK